MSEPPAIPVADLRLFVTDPSELAKGAELADKRALTHLARHENKLFADASGSGAAPYKVQIVFGEGGKVTGRCSCMAARSRPFCKHAAALLVSWARAPGAFAQTEAPPAGSLPASPTARRANVKTGNVDAAELRKRGVEQAFTLLSELWQTGVVAIAEDRAGQVAEMASSLRELGLRRLAARTLALAALLEMAARRDGSFPADAYAELFSDLWLTVRKLEKHLGGEPLAPEHVEELIGKTWTKKDRQPIDGLALVEYAFLARTTADGFVLRESRFVDVGSGEHFSEKQILPAMLAKRMPPKPSYRDRVLVGAAGTLYPSFSPRRLDLADVGSVRELDTSTLRATIERALPSMDRALGMLIERRRDPFAPGSVPVLVRVDGMLPGGRARLFDGDGKTLFVGGGREEEDALAGALAGMRVVAVFGDVTLEGALPTLLPLAALGERDGAPALVPLGGDDASAREETKRSAVTAGAAGWAEAARAAGVSPAATLLGEVRDDLAQGFHDGARAAATARFVDPLAARLTELSLGKQADALRAVASAGDPIDALDALVKVHAVLGIAVSRMASAAPVDRGALVRIPRMPSLAIRAPSELLAPAVAVALEARGELSRWERAYHVAVHYEQADPEKLLADTQTYWGDGFAAPFVVAAAPAHPELAAARAARVLSEGRGADSWRPSTSRLAKLTAIRVLATLGTPAARARLAELGPKQLDRGLLAHARRALHGTSPVGLVELRETMSRVLAAPTMDERA
ncbi:MAG: HEAT repeat domain-containing protein, partial [Deltaproteobacteria bacterium]|nr:HEAT repeat domain-containing protein [Deltaproteobacteria bacterium]